MGCSCVWFWRLQPVYRVPQRNESVCVCVLALFLWVNTALLPAALHLHTVGNSHNMLSHLCVCLLAQGSTHQSAVCRVVLQCWTPVTLVSAAFYCHTLSDVLVICGFCPFQLSPLHIFHSISLSMLHIWLLVLIFLVHFCANLSLYGRCHIWCAIENIYLPWMYCNSIKLQKNCCMYHNCVYHLFLSRPLFQINAVFELSIYQWTLENEMQHCFSQKYKAA